MSIAERTTWYCPTDENSEPEVWGTGRSTTLRYRPKYRESPQTPTDIAGLIIKHRRIESDAVARVAHQQGEDLSRRLSEVISDILRLISPEDECAGGEILPSFKTIAYASLWVTKLITEVDRLGGEWIRPHVVANPAGEIVFTWWHGNRTLTIYVTENSAEYVESWGINIRTEMADGDADSIVTCRGLWSRLTSG